MKCMITVGNKSNNIDFLSFAYEHGVRDFRINMDYIKDTESAFDNLKSLGKQDITIYNDYQGDKFRVILADNTNEVMLREGQRIRFYFEHNINNHFISNLASQKDRLAFGHIISISDGKLYGEVLDITDIYFESVLIKVDYVLRNNAGICFLGNNAPSVGMTEQVCRRIIKTIDKNRIPEWLILSFVDNKDEIKDVIPLIHNLGIKVMAKIETPRGVKRISSISPYVDGLMLGRGDLRNTSGETYHQMYRAALEEFRVCPLFKGVGTFFLQNFSETKAMTSHELDDIKNLSRFNIDYFMISKEVVNSRFPNETILKIEEILNGGI